MTKRLSLRDLTPGTDYELQARIKSNGSASEWSPKFKFTTVTDQIAPNIPANVSFIVDDDSYVANWDTVTQNVDGTPAALFKYNMELRKGTTVKHFSVAPSDDPIQEYGWTFDRIKQLFGANTTSLDFRVQAVNVARIQSGWSPWNNANINAPDAPTGGVVEETTDGLKISWTAPVNQNNLAGYHVYISTDSAFTPSILNRVYEGSSTTFTYNTATYAMHYIKIRSYSKYGQESADLVLSGTPVDPFVVDNIAPDVPSGLSVSVDRSGAVARALVSWSFSATGANQDIQAFAVRYRKVGDTNWFMEFADKNARSLYADLPQPYANYEFQISSIDFVANYSAWSATVTLTAGIAGAPPQTTGVTATPGLGSIQLSWTASTHADVTYGGYYEVQVAKTSAFTTGLLTYKTGNTSISITGLDLGTIYYYRVRAVDVDGNAGTYSAAASVTTGDVVIPAPTDGNPPASSPAATVTPGFGQLFVNWSPVSNADPVTYEIHLSTTSTFTPTLGGTTLVANTPGTVVTLTKDAAGAALTYGTTYYVRIIAKDADTTSGNAPAAGTVGSGAPKKIGSGDIITVIADQIATGSLGAATVTIATGGVIQSANYVANTTGFKLSDTVVDIQSGVVNFGTLRAGTVTTTGLSIGAGGLLTVDSTGAIQSNNYAAGSTGWKLSSSGLDAPGLTVNAGQINGGTFTGGNFIVGSGGSVRSSNYNTTTGVGWNIDSTGVTIYNGTIQGSAVIANQLSSSNGAFSINSSGYATFSGAKILGTTVLGSAASNAHSIQSYNYSPGSAGWMIDASGAAEFNGGSFKTGTAGQRIVISGGSISAYDSGGVLGTMYMSSGRFVFDKPLMSQYLYANYVYSQGSVSALNLSGAGINLDPQSGNVSINSRLSVSVSTETYNLSVTGSLQTSLDTGANNISGNASSIYTAGKLFATNPDTTTNAANVRYATGGQLLSVTSSALKYKKNIKSIDDITKEMILSLEPKQFQYKNFHHKGDEIVYGFIADEAHDIGLNRWVGYENGEIEDFDYAKFGAVAHQMVLIDHDEQLELLKEEVKTLKELVKNLRSELDK